MYTALSNWIVVARLYTVHWIVIIVRKLRIFLLLHQSCHLLQWLHYTTTNSLLGLKMDTALSNWIFVSSLYIVIEVGKFSCTVPNGPCRKACVRFSSALEFYSFSISLQHAGKQYSIPQKMYLFHFILIIFFFNFLYSFVVVVFSSCWLFLVVSLFLNHIFKC